MDSKWPTGIPDDNKDGFWNWKTTFSEVTDQLIARKWLKEFLSICQYGMLIRFFVRIYGWLNGYTNLIIKFYCCKLFILNFIK